MPWKVKMLENLVNVPLRTFGLKTFCHAF